MHPHAHRLASDRDLYDHLGLKLVRDADRLDQLDYRLGNIVLVEVDERLLKLIGAEVVQHLLRRAPVILYLLLWVVRVSNFARLDRKHDAHRLQNETHTRRRLLERLDLDDLRLVELREALDRGVQSR